MVTARANRSLHGVCLLWPIFLLVVNTPVAGAIREIINRSDAQFINASGHWNSFSSLPVSVLVTDQGTGLFIQKTASRQTAEPGDLLDYTLQIRNVSSNALSTITVTDFLPAGFAYQGGSSRFNGIRVRDPTGGAGPRLEFTVGPLAANETVSLTYRVLVGPGAAEGDAVNRAQAISGGPLRLISNMAECRVHVGGGVFTDRAIVFGKIFVDLNTNRVQDVNEPGVPGVRIYLQDGTYSVTDSEGKYSLYGLRPLTHVARVDKTTLPIGAKLLPLSNRHSDEGGTQMMELQRGELHKADFALSPVEGTMREVERRRMVSHAEDAEAVATLKGQLTPDGVPVSRGDPRGLPASGVIGGGINGGPAASTLTPVKPRHPLGETPSKSRATNSPLFDPLLPADSLNAANSNLPISPLGLQGTPRLDPAITNVDNSLGFVDLKDGDTLPMAQAAVRVKGIEGGKLTLLVNETEVSANRIGRRLAIRERQVEIVEFIGVPLKPGTNHLDLRQFDAFGNVRGSNCISVIAPDKLARIHIILPKKEQSADGRATVAVRVEMRDSQGVLVTSRTPLTLEASAGQWQTKDLDPAEPGTQVFSEGGAGEYGLLAPVEPGDSTIRVSSGLLKSEVVLPFLPDLRPLIAAGILEGRVSLNSLKAGSIVPARSRDGFEEELRSWAANKDDSRAVAAGRAAFFLKGKIKGEYLLTAGFDSEKETRERLFRDIQPDEFYPVYGDAGAKGFDAQSTGRLYVRVDKKKCYLLYGDFITASQSEARSLGNYSRSLTGIREHYEKSRLAANLWASHDTSRQVIEELPANGTSGPYFFRTADGIVNSEKVEIITRDRDQPALILQSLPMSRFTDYEFEPFSGRILFKAPVPSLDRNLNPIFVRVTYEVDQGGEKFWVYGADAQVKVAPWLEVGGAVIRDENPVGDYGLYSANATVKVAPKTFLIGEFAQSDTEFADGSAGRVELRHQDNKTDARVYYGRAENTFSNTASILAAGRTEAGGKISYRLAANTRLVGQALLTESLANEGERKGVRLDVEHTFANQVRLELGGRYSTETANPASATTVGVAPNEVTSLRAKLAAPVPKLKGASVYAEYENDVVEPDKRLVAVGGDYQVQAKTRLYARHEFINALGGPFELNTVQQRHATLIGLDTAYMKDGTLFNEYRMRDAVSGREAEAAIGLRNKWNLFEGVRLNTSFERISPVHRAEQNEATAATGAIEYTRHPDWKATARLELRTSEPNDSLLNTFGYAHKLNDDWTFLGRTIVYLVDNKAPGAGDKAQARLQAGLAWRQALTNRWNALGKYEYKHENDRSLSASLDRSVHMLLLDINFQPAADWIFSGHYGGKLAFEHSNGIDGVSDAHLFALRATYDLTRRWDVGLSSRVLFSGGSPAVQFGVGPEVGFRLHDSVRIACGYNIFGFRDRDLSSEEYTNHGFYVALRLMFDESLFGLRKENKP
jgi:large repetitive protein